MNLNLKYIEYTKIGQLEKFRVFLINRIIKEGDGGGGDVDSSDMLNCRK